MTCHTTSTPPVTPTEHPLTALTVEVDHSDPAARRVTPTVLSIPATILARFAIARRTETSHTSLLLNALRAHASRLPELVQARRPKPAAGDLFPCRPAPGTRPDRPGPLRIRPTAAELATIDALTTWVNAELRREHPAGPTVTRSEVAAAALDAYLPHTGESA